MAIRKPVSQQADGPVDAKTPPTNVQPPTAGALGEEQLYRRRILRSAAWKAVASNPALLQFAADIDALKKVIREVAEDGAKFMEE